MSWTVICVGCQNDDVFEAVVRPTIRERWRNGVDIGVGDEEQLQAVSNSCADIKVPEAGNDCSQNLLVPVH